jgi:hypothetical protein
MLQDANGKDTIDLQYWYDEDENIIKKFVNDKDGGIIYARRGQEMFARRAKDNKDIWRKKYNNKGQLVDFKHGTKHYAFAYLPENIVEITFFGDQGEHKYRRPYSAVSKLFENTFLTSKTMSKN